MSKTLDVPEPNFGNRTIFTGDNLLVLRGLNSNTVDLIYLDPPFNSGRDWNDPLAGDLKGTHFKDRWSRKDIDPLDHDILRAENPVLHDVVLAGAAAGGVPTMSYLLYMAPRLMEMRRVLKPSGSIFYHLDQNESHAVKLMMDVIFGRKNFRNEIVWKRNASHSDGKGFGRVSDAILFYSPSGIDKDAVRVPLSDDAIASRFRYEDGKGRYEAGAVHAEGLSGGGYEYEFHGFMGLWRFPKRRMEEFEAAGLIHFPKKKGGRPLVKKYLADHKGVVPGNIWADIPKALGKERVGFDTQKPTKLLERIIRAASNEGDMVLDPFCGCATTLIAAEKLDRQWAGIDLSRASVDKLRQRLNEQLGLAASLAIDWDTNSKDWRWPRRDDLGDIRPPREHKPDLFREQGDPYCRGCGRETPYDLFEVDHIVSKKKHNGTDHKDNLQLLCGGCNKRKGSGKMSDLTKKILSERGITRLR